MRNKCLFFKYRDIQITVFSILILCFLILSFVILFFVRFNFSYRYNGLVLREGDCYYVSIIVSDNELRKIQVLELLVDGKKNNFDIVNISDEYSLSYALKREVTLRIDLADNKKIVNNIVSLVFVDKKTFFERMKEIFYERD